MHSLDRRDLLLGLLGMPLAATVGCGSRQPLLPPRGEIVGAPHTLGHRTRERNVPTIADEQCEAFDVIVVGGGIAGLAAARQLKHAGVERLALLEIDSQVGGTSQADRRGKFPAPWGAHYLPAPSQDNGALIKLLDEFGAVTGYTATGEPQFAEEMLVRDPEERIFVNGRWYEGLWPTTLATAADEAHLQRFQQEVQRWIDWRDGQGRRAFTLPVSACSNDAEVVALDQQTFADWLNQRNLSAPVFRWWVEYATRDDYGTTLEQTSAWAGLFYFASRARLRATESQPLLSWPDGNGWLVRQLAASVQQHVRPGEAVVNIAASQEQARLTTLDAGGQVRGYRCQQVVFAAPHFLTPFIISDFPASRQADSRQFQYGAWLVANLTLRQRPANVGFEPAWDNVLYSSRSLGYVAATHQSGVDHGATAWTYYLPLLNENPRAARSELLALDWQTASEIILSDLEQAHTDLRPLLEQLDVMRWGHAMIQPRPGFLFGGARQREQAPWRCVHFAHSDLSGVALFEEAYDHGVRVAQEIVAARAQNTAILKAMNQSTSAHAVSADLA